MTHTEDRLPATAAVGQPFAPPVRSLDARGLLRRRWPLLVVLAIVGAVVGGLWPVHSTKPSSPLSPVWQATAVIGASTGSTGQSNESSLITGAVTTAATSTVVASSVARTIGGSVTGSDVLSSAHLAAGPTATSAEIVASAATAAIAARVANAEASAVVKAVAATVASSTSSELAQARHQVSSDQAQLQSVESQLLQLQTAQTQAEAQARANGGGAVTPQQQAQIDNPQIAILQAQEGVLANQYSTAYQNVASLSAASSDPLAVVTRASADTASRLKASSSSALDRRPVRALLGLVAGLLLGLVVALLLEQGDDRLHGRVETEAAFGLPVLAEVSRRRGGAVVRPLERSRDAEAFRTVRAALLAGALPVTWGALDAPYGAPLASAAAIGGQGAVRAIGGAAVAASGEGASGASLMPGRETRVLMLACPANESSYPGAVMSLASAIAETGQSVLVVSFDEAELLSFDDGRDGSLGETGAPLDGLIHATELPGVFQAIVGAEQEATTGGLAAIISNARRLADVVLVDAGPVLLAHHATELAGVCDRSALVAELGVTRSDDANRAVSLMGGPEQAVGVLLTGVSRSRRRYRGRHAAGGRGLRR